MDIDAYERELEEEARHEVAHRVAGGKGVLPIERKNEQAEKRLAEEITERARHGEHFHSSLHPDEPKADPRQQ